MQSFYDRLITLPPELQRETLLNMPVGAILAYCMDPKLGRFCTPEFWRQKRRINPDLIKNYISELHIPNLSLEEFIRILDTLAIILGGHLDRVTKIYVARMLANSFALQPTAEDIAKLRYFIQTEGYVPMLERDTLEAAWWNNRDNDLGRFLELTYFGK